MGVVCVCALGGRLTRCAGAPTRIVALRGTVTQTLLSVFDRFARCSMGDINTVIGVQLFWFISHNNFCRPVAFRHFSARHNPSSGVSDVWRSVT